MQWRRSVKIYFAGPWEYGPKLKDLRNQIQSIFPIIKITSTWLNIETSVSSNNAMEAGQYAQQDLDDVLRADMLVLFNPEGFEQSPGRNIEFGYALALGHALAIVGRRCGVFQYLPQIQHFPHTTYFLQWLNEYQQTPYLRK
ncbi:MAG: hypothetical protein B7Z37_03045 [Verrucomicrobia bacterium 12-59-8]|nr:MAG: hypothetical protein B7Z37_03045 [Verrucomicrobia bacterium 12-59-8]